MIISYEVEPISTGMEVFLFVTTSLIILWAIFWIGRGITKRDPFLAGFVGVFVSIMAFALIVIVPAMTDESNREIRAFKQAVESVYDEAVYKGNFVTGSKDGEFVKAAVIELEDNEILIQEIKLD